MVGDQKPVGGRRLVGDVLKEICNEILNDFYSNLMVWEHFGVLRNHGRFGRFSLKLSLRKYL